MEFQDFGTTLRVCLSTDCLTFLLFCKMCFSCTAGILETARLSTCKLHEAGLN